MLHIQPTTTPAMLREAAEHVAKALEIYTKFQLELEAAGDDLEMTESLLACLNDPWYLSQSIPSYAEYVADQYGAYDDDEAFENRTIYDESDFVADVDVSSEEAEA